MKKLKLFLAACAAMVGLNAQAQLTDGTVYWIQDTGTGQFISQGANWGTQATVQEVGGLGWQAVYVSDGVYKLKNIMWNKGNNADLGLRTSDRFCDQAAEDITLIASGDGYKINTTNGGYLCNNGDNTSYGLKRLGSTTDADAATVWKFLTKSEYDAAIQAYKDANAATYATSLGYSSVTTVEALEALITDVDQFISKDYTSSITNASLASSWDGWTHGEAAGSNRGEGAGVGSGCAEFWNGCGVATQTVTGLPNGLYKVEFVGTFRPKNATEANNIASGETSSPAYVYANDAKIEFLHWIDVPNKANGRGGITKANGYGHSFYTYVNDGTLALGVVQSCWENGVMWCPFGQFTLTYYTDQVSDEDITALIAQIPAEGTVPASVYSNLTSLKNTLQSTKTIAAFNALAGAINEANALVSNVTRYKAVKEAALALAENTNVTAADAALAAATTNEAIDAAVATLRTAFLAELPNVTVPETGLDVTAVMVDNASVSQNTDYWTIANLSSTGGNAGVCNYGECEFYNRNFKFYQTLALSKGTWEFGVTGFHRAGNHSTYFYAGGSKVLIPGVPGSGTEGMGGIEWVNNMAQAKTYFDNGNGKVSVKFALDAAGNVEIGIDNQDTETDKWTIFRDFTLKYFGEAVDLSAYVTQLAEAVAKAEAVNGTVPAAVYSSLADVVTANNKTYTTVADYETAISNIETATANAKALVAAYAAYKTLNSAVQALYDVANYEELSTGAHDALGAALSTAATDVETKTTVDDINAVAETLRAAGATYAGAANPTGTAKFNLTFMLTNPDVSSFAAWTPRADVPGWYTDQTDGNSQTMVNDGATSEDGTKTNFFEYWSNPAKANDAFALYQKVTLPVGTFDINCYAFAQDQYAGTNSVGVYFYANDTQGSAVTTARLTQAGISFVNATEQEVKIGLKTIAGNSYNWMGIGYVELYKVPAKVVTIDENADYVAENAAAKVELKRTIKADVWNTFVVPFALTYDELKAAFGDDVAVSEFSENSEDANNVTVNFNNMTTPAITPNKPVLLKTSAAGNSYTFEGRTIAAGEAIAAGKNFDFVGTYAASTTVAEGDYFISSNKLYKSIGTTTVKGTRAYLKAKETTSTGGEVKLYIDGLETAISEISGEAAEQGAIYNIAGQRVNKAQKGIYIVNGKKVIVK